MAVTMYGPYTPGPAAACAGGSRCRGWLSAGPISCNRSDEARSSRKRRWGGCGEIVVSVAVPGFGADIRAGSGRWHGSLQPGWL